MDHRDNRKKNITNAHRYILGAINPVVIVSIAFYAATTALDSHATILPRLSIAEYYSDNLNLAPEGFEQDGYITELNPGFAFNQNGPRVDLQFDYSLQALYFSSDSDKDEVYHNASGQANITVFPQSAFLDTSATFSQQFISPDGAIDLDNLSGSHDSTDITTLHLSPYVLQQFGNTANAEYRVSQETVHYSQNATAIQSDSTSTIYSINIASGLAFNDMHWRFNLSRNEFKADNTEDSTLQNALLETGFRVSPKFELLATIGYEENDYQHTYLTEDPSGDYWSAGVGWNPGRRTQFRATFGERFFGKTKSLLINHRTRHSIWNVEYNEEITTTPQLQIALSVASTPADTGTGDPVLPANPSNPLLVRAASVIVLKRLSSGVSYQRSKITLNMSIYDEARNYQDLGQEEKSRGIMASCIWQFMSRTSLNLSGSRYRIEYLVTSHIDYVGQAELALEREIRRTITGRMGVRVLDRNSSDNLTEYHRNLAFVSVNIDF